MYRQGKPRISTSTSSSQSQDGADPQQKWNSLILFIYGNRRVLGTRYDCYESSILTCRSIFTEIPGNHKISFYTKDFDVCDGQMAEIPSVCWSDIVPRLKSINVVAEMVVHELPPTPPVPLTLYSDIQLFVKTLTGKTITIGMNPNNYVIDLCNRIYYKEGIPADQQRLTLGDKPLEKNRTLKDYGIVRSEMTINLFITLRGGKPVVYLFSPSDIEASVKLSLVPEWKISVIYPVVPIKAPTTHSNEELTWRVRVHPSGDLTELNTGLDVAYLFWEALTNPGFPLSPPSSPRLGPSQVQNVERFIPNNATLDDANSVLLATDKITPYLDSALKALGLHTEARTSFITYWLPSILKHKTVALRFLPQAAYENAARLDVSPSPDVVTRIFMLFQGVDNDDLGLWSASLVKASEDVALWVNVVGVDVDRTLDKQLFRVIEWGGMEVLNS